MGDPAYVLTGPPLAFAPGWQDAFLSRAVIAHTQTEGDRDLFGRALPGAITYHLDRHSADWLKSRMDY